MLTNLSSALTPDSEGILVRGLIWVLGVHWKTSLSGFLVFIIGTLSTIATFLTPYTISAPKSTAAYINYAVLLINFVVGLARVWVGLIQQDAGTTLAVVQGEAEPVAVASHETPFDTKAQVVEKEKQ